jgi:hypothetical protein
VRRTVTRAGTMAVMCALAVSCSSPFKTEASDGTPINWPGFSGEESYAVSNADSLEAWMRHNEGSWGEEAANTVLFLEGKGESLDEPASILISSSSEQVAEQVAEAFSQWESNAGQDSYVNVYSKKDKKLKASIAD